MKTNKLTIFKAIKRISLFSATLMLLFAFSLNAQEVKYSDSWGDAGMSIEKTDAQKTVVNYSIESFSFQKIDIKEEEMVKVSLPGNFLFNDEGAPDVAGGGRFIAIPNGAKVNLNIKSMRKEVFKNKKIAPAPRIPKENEKGPLTYEKDPKIYEKNAFYPAEPIKVSEVKNLRGVDAVILGVTPFQYNPVTEELIVYRDIEIELTYEGGNGQIGDERLRSRWYDPILEDALLNSEILPEIDYSKRTANRGKDDTGYEYLIISPNNAEFQQWADSILEFRMLQGIYTGVVTIDEVGGNSASTIENYINNAYQNWDIPPVAVLLLGDYGSNGNNSITSPIWDGYCVSDHIYADVDNDDIEEVIFARMTAQNETHLETMVTKAIHYEKDPPTNAAYYDNPITALGWQTERWFQICSETVGGFWKHEMNKDPLRVNAIYSGNPNSDPWSTATNTSTVLNYFGPNGLGYIPASPGELGGWTGGNATMVNNGINSGAFMLQHRDHGSENGWGEPDYDSNDINGLQNEDLTFVFSINCLTGKYNWGNECFAEKFHRHTYNGENSGALGIIAASEVSYSFVNDTYVWGMYDNMWPEFMPDYGQNNPIEERDVLPAFGNASGKYFLMQSNWPYNTNNKEVTYNLFHHHGDAFTSVYAEMPQELTVNHNPILYSGVTSFSVTADEGAFIALTVNGEIIGTAEGTGAPVDIQIDAQLPPNWMKVTITKQNYFRYSADVQVIPPEGPYVVRDEFSINDEAGNNNGMVDFGESILLNMGVKNVGVEPAEDVTVTIDTDDDYVTITDDEEFYGTVQPDEVITIDGAFAFDVANDIPEGHAINFTLFASDGDETWETYFSIMGHAPLLTVGNMMINDLEGGNGNGRIDPGEAFDISITTYNEGTSDALDAMSTLSSMSEYITINEGSYEIGTIEAEGSAVAEFNASASDEAPIGTNIYFDFDLTAGEYGAFKEFFAKVGIILEDFETGDFSAFEWSFSGNADWTMDNNVVYEGEYSARSGDIGDQQNSVLEITMEDVLGDTISFYSKVSSESNYDYLVFYVDDQMMSEWSGEQGWSRHAYYIPAGDHTFKWAYEKDWSVSNGQDCGWVDYIEFPAVQNPVPPVVNFEASATLLYPGSEVDFTDLSTNEPNAWSWEFEGGEPATSNQQNPSGIMYDTPGTYDVTLSATNQYGTAEMTMEDYITVVQPHFEFEGGNPADPVYTMYLSGATVDGEDMQAFDELAIFDGSTMVGNFALDQVCTQQNQFENALIAFSTVVSGNGYDPGNPMIIKAWDQSEGVETANVEITFYDPYGDAWTDDVFPDGDGAYSISDLDFSGMGMQQMFLNTGYQFISSYMEPMNPDLMYLCEDLMYDETLDFARSSDGSMLQKIGPNWVNNIGDWNTMEGYLFKMFEADDFMMEGSSMDPQTPMPLYTGYQFISYLPAAPMDALEAVDGILDNLDFIRSSDGSMLQKIGPNWVNNIGNFNPGEGYLVKMLAEDELIYPEVLKAASPVAKEVPAHFDFAGGNPADPVYTMFIEPGMGIEAGDEIAAYSDGRMPGSVVITSDKATANDLAVFSTLVDSKGYEAGNPVKLLMWDTSEGVERNLVIEFNNPHGDAWINNTYPLGDGEYSMVHVKAGTTGFDNVNGIISLYPNPATDDVNIQAPATINRITVYDYTGKMVQQETPATNNYLLDAGRFETGIYVIKIETTTKTVNKQLVIR